MSDVVLKVSNLSKQYYLGNVGTGTLSHDLNRMWHKFRGSEDPYLKIGEVNDRTQKGASDFAWALNDINFELKRGEVLGIIGRNGAGKSTLLKIISRITSPTKGEVRIKGRINSLLEVGTGFHPELSGRENIYLNGAINGMSRQEITRKLDEIIDFSGVQKYIDTPVKRYSSGMMVRLGFSVAAHLEPDILIVDEVLAVGDFDFQKKCLDRMNKDVGQGRTILFVSHALESISNFTTRCLLMRNGCLIKDGTTREVIKEYLGNDTESFIYERSVPKKADQKAVFNWIKLDRSTNEVSFEVDIFEPIKMAYSLQLCNSAGFVIYTVRDTDQSPEKYSRLPGRFIGKLNLETHNLSSGSYYINLSMAELGVQRFDMIERAISFEVTGDKNLNEISTRAGVLKVSSQWDVFKI